MSASVQSTRIHVGLVDIWISHCAYRDSSCTARNWNKKVAKSTMENHGQCIYFNGSWCTLAEWMPQ